MYLWMVPHIFDLILIFNSYIKYIYLYLRSIVYIWYSFFFPRLLRHENPYEKLTKIYYISLFGCVSLIIICLRTDDIAEGGFTLSINSQIHMLDTIRGWLGGWGLVALCLAVQALIIRVLSGRLSLPGQLITSYKQPRLSLLSVSNDVIRTIYYDFNTLHNWIKNKTQIMIDYLLLYTEIVYANHEFIIFNYLSYSFPI